MANQLAMDKLLAIKNLAAAGYSGRRIAETLKISRKAVRRHLAADFSKDTKAPTGSESSETPSETPSPTLSRSLCAAYQRPILEKAMLAANARRPKRERLTYQRMLEGLRLEGYRGSYDNVRRYARSWAEREGERTEEAHVPLSFTPGEAYQFDWSRECVVIGGVTTMLAQAGSATAACCSWGLSLRKPG